MTKRELHTITRVINAVRIVDDTMPVQTLSVFLGVAQKEPISISDLATLTGLAQSSASRNVAALSEWHWLKKPGLGLVKLEVDPMELRKKLVTLTPKGKKLVEQLTGLVEGRV